MARAFYPQLFTVVNGQVTNGDIAFPTLVINLLPAGLVGLMIAALLAALMGAMSSVFNSTSTMVTLDFYKKFRPAATEKTTGELRPHRDRRDGGAGLAVGAVHSFVQRAAVGLPAKRAGVHQPANRRVLYFWDFVAAAEWPGRDHFAAGRIRAWRGAICLRGAGQNRALQLTGLALADGHELSALRGVHVCGVYRWC